MESLVPLLTEDALVVVEHEARTAPAACDAYEKTDERKWGYVGVSFFRLKE